MNESTPRETSLSRQAELEALIFHESCAVDGIAIMIRMGQDPGRERMRRLNSVLQELEELTRGQTTLDRRLAYALFGLAVYPDQETRSWARAGREWPLELVSEELIELVIHVERIFEGGLTGEEMDEAS